MQQQAGKKPKEIPSKADSFSTFVKSLRRERTDKSHGAIIYKTVDSNGVVYALWLGKHYAFSLSLIMSSFSSRHFFYGCRSYLNTLKYSVCIKTHFAVHFGDSGPRDCRVETSLFRHNVIYHSQICWTRAAIKSAPLLNRIVIRMTIDSAI